MKDRLGFASLTLGTKAAHVPLQAADIFAYETFRHYPRWTGTESRPGRYPLDVLFRGIGQHNWGVVTIDTLKQLHDWLRP